MFERDTPFGRAILLLAGIVAIAASAAALATSIPWPILLTIALFGVLLLGVGLWQTIRPPRPTQSPPQPQLEIDRPKSSREQFHEMMLPQLKRVLESNQDLVEEQQLSGKTEPPFVLPPDELITHATLYRLAFRKFYSGEFATKYDWRPVQHAVEQWIDFQMATYLDRWPGRDREELNIQYHVAALRELLAGRLGVVNGSAIGQEIQTMSRRLIARGN